MWCAATYYGLVNFRTPYQYMAPMARFGKKKTNTTQAEVFRFKHKSIWRKLAPMTSTYRSRPSMGAGTRGRRSVVDAFSLYASVSFTHDHGFLRRTCVSVARSPTNRSKSGRTRSIASFLSMRMSLWIRRPAAMASGRGPTADGMGSE